MAFDGKQLQPAAVFSNLATETFLLENLKIKNARSMKNLMILFYWISNQCVLYGESEAFDIPLYNILTGSSKQVPDRLSLWNVMWCSVANWKRVELRLVLKKKVSINGMIFLLFVLFSGSHSHWSRWTISLLGNSSAICVIDTTPFPRSVKHIRC